MEESFSFGNSASVALLFLSFSASWMTHLPDKTLFNGGWPFLVVSGSLLVIVAVPIVWLQVLVGQLSRLGPLGIWRGFPLLRGVGIVWMIFIFVSTCADALETSKIFAYFVPTLTAWNDFPWTHCHNGWNTKRCKPVILKRHSTTLGTSASSSANATTRLDAAASEFLANPAMEYRDATSDLNAQNSASLFLTWVLILLPLVQGSKSLIKSLYVGYPLILLLEALLSIRAALLVDDVTEVRCLFVNDEISNDGYYAGAMVTVALGFSLGSQFGLPFIAGKYARRKAFLFFPIVLAAVAGHFLHLLNRFKEASFAQVFSKMTGRECRLFFDGNRRVTFVPSLLTVLPGARFWLLIHFTFSVIAALPALSFSVETLAVSIAEGTSAERTKVPQNLPATVSIVVSGFLGSLLISYLRRMELDTFLYSFYSLHTLVSFLMALLLITVILPLTMYMSKAANDDEREDLFQLVLSQGTSRWAAMRKTIFVASIVIFSVAVFLLPIGVVAMSPRLEVFNHFGISKAIMMIAPVVVIGLVAAIQAILLCVKKNGHPYCQPLGPVRIAEKARFNQL